MEMEESVSCGRARAAGPIQRALLVTSIDERVGEMKRVIGRDEGESMIDEESTEKEREMREWMNMRETTGLI